MEVLRLLEITVISIRTHCATTQKTVRLMANQNLNLLVCDTDNRDYKKYHVMGCDSTQSEIHTSQNSAITYENTVTFICKS